MAKTFDASVKQLIADRPQDYATWLDLPERPVAVENVDLSVSQPAVDAVLRLGDPPRRLLHLEAQVSSDPLLEPRLLKYNAMLHDRGQGPRLPVRTVLLLLRPQAEPQGRRFTGHYCVHDQDGACLELSYRVVRLWECPPEPLLAHPGTLPLAVLADLSCISEEGLVEVIAQRLSQQAPQAQKNLATLTQIFTGLWPRLSLAELLLRRFRVMKESVTYQAILAEGRIEGEARGEAKGKAEGLREALLRLGRARLGEPDPATEQTIQAFNDPRRLQELFDRAITAERWSDVLMD